MSILFSVILWALFILNDVDKNAHAQRQQFVATIVLRALDCLIGVLCYLALGSRWLSARHAGVGPMVEQALMFVGMLTFGVSQILFGVWQDNTLDPTYSMFMILIPSMSPTFFHQRFLYTVTFSLTLLLAFITLTTACAAYTSLTSLVTTVCGTAMANALFCLFAYRRERQIRQDFLSARQLAADEAKSQALLNNMMPASAVAKLRAGAEYIYNRHESVTVLFSHIVDFDALTARLPPLQLVTFLNALFSRFDALTDELGVYKVETIGDVFLVCANCPVEYEREDHAPILCVMALAMMEAAKEVRVPDSGEVLLKLGLHTGEVIAGVVGAKYPRFRLMGDTVNTASRMSTTCVANAIQLSPSTYARVAELRGGGGEAMFVCRDRGPIPIKGKGMMNTHLLLSHTYPYTSHTIIHPRRRHPPHPLLHPFTPREDSFASPLDSPPQGELEAAIRARAARIKKFGTMASHSPESEGTGEGEEGEGGEGGEWGGLGEEEDDVDAILREREDGSVRERGVAGSAPSSRRGSHAVARGGTSARGGVGGSRRGSDGEVLTESLYSAREGGGRGVDSLEGSAVRRGSASVALLSARAGGAEADPTLLTAAPPMAPTYALALAPSDRGPLADGFPSPPSTGAVIASPAVRRVLVQSGVGGGSRGQSVGSLGSLVQSSTEHLTPHTSFTHHTSHTSHSCDSSSDPSLPNPPTLSPATTGDALWTQSMTGVHVSFQPPLPPSSAHSRKASDVLPHFSIFPTPSLFPTPTPSSSFVPIKKTRWDRSVAPDPTSLTSPSPNLHPPLRSPLFPPPPLRTLGEDGADKVLITAASDQARMDKLFKLGPTQSIMRPKGRSALDYLTQRFITEPALEAQFHAYATRKNLRHSRFWVLLCCAAFVPLSVYETLVNLDLAVHSFTVQTESWALRVVGVLAGALYAYASYRPVCERWMQWLTAALLCGEGMLFVYMAIVFNDYQSSYGIGILLILLCILHMFVHLRFVFALASSTLVLIFYALASYAYYGTVPGVILMVLAGNVMYAESNYWTEFLARQDFIRRLKRENEQVRTQQFLDNMLPPPVLHLIKQGSIVAQTHAAADVIFCDIVSFTAIASSIPAEDVVAVLNVMFSTYDALSTQYCVYKVETIGDCWMGCCGVVSHEVNHSQNIVDFALAMLKSTRGFRVQTGGGGGGGGGAEKSPAGSPKASGKRSAEEDSAHSKASDGEGGQGGVTHRLTRSSMSFAIGGGSGGGGQAPLMPPPTTPQSVQTVTSGALPSVTAAQGGEAGALTGPPELSRQRTADSSASTSGGGGAPSKGHPLVVRIGIHSGAVIAGVVGRKCARYHLFGETVTVAEEMEQHGLAGKVVLSEATRQSMLAGMAGDAVGGYELECIDPLVRAEPSPTGSGVSAAAAAAAAGDGGGGAAVPSARVLHRYIVRRARSVGGKGGGGRGQGVALAALAAVSTRRGSAGNGGVVKEGGGAGGVHGSGRGSVAGRQGRRVPLDAALNLQL